MLTHFQIPPWYIVAQQFTQLQNSQTLGLNFHILRHISYCKDVSTAGITMIQIQGPPCGF